MLESKQHLSETIQLESKQFCTGLSHKTEISTLFWDFAYLRDIEMVCDIEKWCCVVFAVVQHLYNGDGQVHTESVVQHEAEKYHYVQHLDAC